MYLKFCWIERREIERETKQLKRRRKRKRKNKSEREMREQKWNSIY
jgi:hypothetical protein